MVFGLRVHELRVFGFRVTGFWRYGFFVQTQATSINRNTTRLLRHRASRIPQQTKSPKKTIEIQQKHDRKTIDEP